jgi:hypothetical protein
MSDESRDNASESNTNIDCPPNNLRPLQANNPKEAESVGASNESRVREMTRELHVLEKWNIYCQMGLFILGIGLAAIYGFQLKTMRGQLRVQQCQMQMDEAAQVMLEGATVSDFQSGNAIVRLSFKNTGKTPSEHTQVTVATGFIGPAGNENDEVRAVQYNFEHMPSDAISVPLSKLFSQVSRIVPLAVGGSSLPPENIKQVLAGKARFIVFGTYQYTDIFGKRYSNPFCMNYTPEQDRLQAYMKTYMGNVIEQLPANMENSDVIKKILTSSVPPTPPHPEAMSLCLSGNE